MDACVKPLFPEGLRVLVIDDDATSLMIIEELLQKCKYEVTTTKRGEEALEMLRVRKDRFDRPGDHRRAHAWHGWLQAP
ncbi:hypothetical protein EJB05_08651, partial [Eragrostis curvula]